MFIAGFEIGVILVRMESVPLSLISEVKNSAQIRIFWTVVFIATLSLSSLNGWLVIEPS